MDDRTASGAPPRRTFLVERYWPGVDEPTARALLSELEQVAGQMTADGIPVEHLGSILMPADQVVFSLIAAANEVVARQVNERAKAPVDRIASAITLPAGAPATSQGE